MRIKGFKLVWLILLVCVIVVTVWNFSRAISKLKINTGTARDTLIVTQKDTVYKEVTKIVLQDIYKTITRVDTLRDSIVVVNFTDSIKCFVVEDTMPDKAYIKAEICSDSFIDMPLDIRSYIIYKPAPDSNKIIYRTDTLTKINQKPISENPLFWGSIVLGFIAGSVLIGSK